jgi:hypothetical protein
MLKGLVFALALTVTGCVAYSTNPSHHTIPHQPIIIQPLPSRLSQCHIYVRRYENCSKLAYTHQVYACQRNEQSYYNNCLYR